MIKYNFFLIQLLCIKSVIKKKKKNLENINARTKKKKKEFLQILFESASVHSFLLFF